MKTKKGKKKLNMATLGMVIDRFGEVHLSGLTYQELDAIAQEGFRINVEDGCYIISNGAVRETKRR